MQNNVLNIYNRKYEVNNFDSELTKSILESCDKVGSFDNKLKIFLNETQLNEQSESLAFVLKIFSAAKFAKEDLCLIRLNEQIPFTEICKSLDIKDVFFFGYTLDYFNLKTNRIYYNNINLGTHRLVFCEAVNDLKNNKNSKAALWNLLKKMYNL